ncbi:MAG: MBL fold metallo-hydrolase [Oscillospiraceae bacterium]|nr:MBL fold metallo-hydrolase [Oscillospiraceae bacterium]
MEWVKLHDVGFGECVVVGGSHGEILMVDCGTLRPRLDDQRLFREDVPVIASQYANASERSFLLSHFHKDHYCGLPLLLRGDPQYFDRIYVPCCPVDRKGVPLLMELAIFIESFVTGPGAETVRMNGANLRFFREICTLATTETIYTLSAGDLLEFDDEMYEVLWPPKENYPFSPELIGLVDEANRILSTSRDSCADAFLVLKDQLCAAYIRCMDAFAYETTADQQERQDCVEDLFHLLDELNDLLPYLHTLRVAQRVSELLKDRSKVLAVGREINGSSLILSSERLLLTGDATPETMGRIAPMLHDSYEVVKAPHHGTQSCWWDGFTDLGITHLLISNGRVRGGGKIARAYGSLNALHHCTGVNHCACYEETGRCCNEGLYCPLCVPETADPTRCRIRGCPIYVGSFWELHPCRCTEKRLDWDAV